MAKQLITCDCSGTMSIDTDGLAQASGVTVTKPCTALCTTQIDQAVPALTTGESIFCCTQEGRVFEALAEDLGVPAPGLLDLRDRAGWTADHTPTLPKMSALVAEAMMPAPVAKAMDVVSEGLCLILGSGSGDVALAAAAHLKDHLGVTVLLETATDLPDSRDFDVVVGSLRRASGALGQFEVILDGLQQVAPGGRGARTLSDPQNGAISQCDIIVDLRGGVPLFSAHEKRDGYLHADPTHPPAVTAAVLAASHLVGTFEKPLYIRAEPILCAHSRADQQGCSRCLDLCPTGAITPNGDHVSIDPMICAGCGACSAACPSGAVSYDAPPVAHTMARVQTLARAYLAAGGGAPRLLAHDAHGAEMIRLAARYGDGLPADVIPLEMAAIGAFGHAEVVAALAAGFASVSLLPGPSADRDALAIQVELARSISSHQAVHLLDIADPDILSEGLYAEAAPAPVTQPVRPMGTRRQITRQAAKALHPQAAALPLPDGAPYGTVKVNTDKCTLCLSCVSLCPSGALGENPDRPQLRFQEDACLQCGLCANLCPEKAITLDPRLDLSDEAFTQRVLNEEDPAECVECGKPFGVKSTIDRITEKLTGHGMFASEDRLRMIQMCDDCRVIAQVHTKDSPFAGAARPRPRTTDDYLSDQRDH